MGTVISVLEVLLNRQDVSSTSLLLKGYGVPSKMFLNKM
jgi:hypothetical protein